MSWTDNGSGTSNYDLCIYKNPRSNCTPQKIAPPQTGSEAANYQSASSANPEIANIDKLTTATHLPHTPWPAMRLRRHPLRRQSLIKNNYSKASSKPAATRLAVSQFKRLGV